MPNEGREIRCKRCGKLLGKGVALDLRIKCPRCREMNHVRDQSPEFECPRAPSGGAPCGFTCPHV